MHVTIAGIDFTVSSKSEIILSKLPDIYRPFLKDGLYQQKPLPFMVSVELQDMPETGKMKKLFDTGQAWTMFTLGKEYFIVLNPDAGQEGPVWITRFSPSASGATIYCGSALITKNGGGPPEVSNPFRYPVDQLLLIYILSENSGALIHASCIGINGAGYMLPGRSGAGKSTLSRLFAAEQKALLLSDDRAAVRKIGNSFRVFGTPWAGDAGIAENADLPLQGIFFIRHGGNNAIRELSARETIERLMAVTSIPWFDKDAMLKVLTCCEDLVSKVPAYELHFRPDREVVTFLEDFIAQNNI